MASSWHGFILTKRVVIHLSLKGKKKNPTLVPFWKGSSLPRFILQACRVLVKGKNIGNIFPFFRSFSFPCIAAGVAVGSNGRGDDHITLCEANEGSRYAIGGDSARRAQSARSDHSGFDHPSSFFSFCIFSVSSPIMD